MIIRSMTIDDYEQVYALWSGIKGFGIRAVDDSQKESAVFFREIQV